MAVMICGSLAYDFVMVFEGRFKDHILPDRIHMLSVSFLVPQLRRNFGGVAGNIAYNLAMLGVESEMLATVGEDFDAYDSWLEKCGVSRRYVERIAGTYTAQAYITTDLDDNQITAFHPGAMAHTGSLHVPSDLGLRLGLVGPHGRDAMIQRADEFVAAGVPFIFDGGQAMPMFDGADLLRFIEKATWIVVNDYESQLLEERTGLTPSQIASRCDAYIVTRGGKGSQIHAEGTIYDIPVVSADVVADPTGCGDAYRAGIIFGLERGLDWPTTGRIASLVASIKVAHHGTQTHALTLQDVENRFHAVFGYRF
jgi:adenosine kinase